ncbi:EAL domain-containing protein [Vibrio jasicida]|uniref:EAL domain-containing protein n=1 Tax=Vibrio jasicida TaxID=766224 RepID=UPI00039FFF26|nr:EAL domain-containing protein [Vibrio jasicida]
MKPTCNEKSKDKPKTKNKTVDFKKFSPYFETIVKVHDLDMLCFEALLRISTSNSELQNSIFTYSKRHQLPEKIEIEGLEFLLSRLSCCSGEFAIKLNPNLLLNEKVHDILINHIEPKNINIELTSYLKIKDWTQIMTRIEEYREIGYRFWLDEVHCGFFELALVNHLQPEVTKIVSDVTKRRVTDGLYDGNLHKMISMIHAFGGKVLAKDIEQLDHFENIERLNFDYAQGGFFELPIEHHRRPI